MKTQENVENDGFDATHLSKFDLMDSDKKPEVTRSVELLIQEELKVIEPENKSPKK